MRVGASKSARLLGSMQGVGVDASRKEITQSTGLTSSGGGLLGGSRGSLLGGSMVDKKYEEEHDTIESKKSRKKDFFSRIQKK